MRLLKCSLWSNSPVLQKTRTKHVLSLLIPFFFFPQYDKRFLMATCPEWEIVFLLLHSEAFYKNVYMRSSEVPLEIKSDFIFSYCRIQIKKSTLNFSDQYCSILRQTQNLAIRNKLVSAANILFRHLKHEFHFKNHYPNIWNWI